MRLIYTLLLYLALPFVLLRLLWRSKKIPGYRKRWSERFGYAPKTNPGCIWLHAVSVGETIAATPLVKAIHEKYPTTKIIMTCTTPTGSEQIQKTLSDIVTHVYAPYDLPSTVNRFINRCRPKIAIIMETELWPNVLHACKTHGIPTLLANARLSPRSAKGYRHIASLTREMLLKISLIAAQSEADAKRFIDLGAHTDKVTVLGNIKFDLQLDKNIIDKGHELKHQINRPTFVAASTHQGEEEIILDNFKKIRGQIPNSLLILVPRHPNRFDTVAKLCEKDFKTMQRSTGNPITPDTDILLGDTMGEMMLFYAASDVAFVAGSFAEIGGHNPLEPAALKLPIITGPHTFNFQKVMALLNQAHGIIQIQQPNDLAETVISLLNNKDKAQNLGENASKVVTQNRGALQQHLNKIANFIGGQTPNEIISLGV